MRIETVITLMIIAALFLGLLAFQAATKPRCPSGTQPTPIRATWVRTVSPLRG